MNVFIGSIAYQYAKMIITVHVRILIKYTRGCTRLSFLYAHVYDKYRVLIKISILGIFLKKP